MYEFEKHEKLTEFIQEMANTGKAPIEWTSFIETLNQALRIHDVSRQSELLCDFLEWYDVDMTLEEREMEIKTYMDMKSHNCY